MKKLLVPTDKKTLWEWCSYFYRLYPEVHNYVNFLYPNNFTNEQLMDLIVPHLKLMMYAEERIAKIYKNADKKNSKKRRK
jgi:hypothetical protein